MLYITNTKSVESGKFQAEDGLNYHENIPDYSDSEVLSLDLQHYFKNNEF